MVDSIRYLFRKFHRVFVCGQIVLICCLHLSVAEKFAYGLAGHPSLQPAGRGSASQGSKTNSVRAAFQSRILTSSIERSLNFLQTKNTFAVRVFFQVNQDRQKSVADRQSSTSESFGIHRPNVDSSFIKINVIPSERKNLAAAHSGIESADDYRYEMFNGAKNQLGLFVAGKDASSLPFLCLRDKRVTGAKRSPLNPSLALGDVEDSPEQRKFTMDTRETSDAGEVPFLVLRSIRGRGQSFLLIEFQIGMTDRSNGSFTEVSAKEFRLMSDGIARSHSRNFLIVGVDRRHSIASQIPFEDALMLRSISRIGLGLLFVVIDAGEFGLRSEATAQTKGFSLSQFVFQSVASFGASRASTPDSFAATVDGVSDAGIDLPAAFDYLNLVGPRHLYVALYSGRSDRAGSNCEQSESNGERLKNQGNNRRKLARAVLYFAVSERATRLRIKRPEVRVLLGAPSFLSNSQINQNQKSAGQKRLRIRLYLGMI